MRLALLVTALAIAFSGLACSGSAGESPGEGTAQPPAAQEAAEEPDFEPGPKADQADLLMQTYELSRELCRHGGTLDELAQGYGADSTDFEDIAEAFAEGYNAAHRDYALEGCMLGLAER